MVPVGMSERQVVSSYPLPVAVASPRPEINIPASVSELSDYIKAASGVDINVCYQCRKCSSGCPVRYEMDYAPAEVLHAARLGLRNLVLKSKTLWLCAGCQTCATRCPQDVNLVKAMDALRALALRRGYKPAEPEVARLYSNMISNIRFFGRLYELGLVGQLKLATRHFTKDVRFGLAMLKRGKLAVLPDMGAFGQTRKMMGQVKKMEAR